MLEICKTHLVSRNNNEKCFIFYFVWVTQTHVVYLEQHTYKEAKESCDRVNGSLCKLTAPVQEKLSDMIITDGFYQPYMEIAFWTNHNGSKALLIEGQEYYSDFPTSGDSEDEFCIYAIYNKNTTLFRWVPTECKSENIKIGDCCYFGVMFHEDTWTATLYLDEVTHETAGKICKKDGGNLVDATKFLNDLISSLFNVPWSDTSVPSFWTQQVVQVDIEKSTFQNDFVQSKENACVYAVIKYDRFQLPEIEFFNGSCNSAKYSFICMRQTNKVSPVRTALTGEGYFLRWKNAMINFPLIEYSGKSYSVDECIDECYRLNNNGYACAAFEYSLHNSTCRFLEYNFKTTAGKYYTPYWDYYLITNIRPIIGGSIVYEDEVLTTSGGSSGSYSHESIASSISGSSILHLDDFLTTSDESSEILNHKSTTSTKQSNETEYNPSFEGKTFRSIVLAIGLVTSLSGIFLILQRILKTPQTHDRSFKEDVMIYMENCLYVDIAKPKEWTGMEYSKADNVPPESFIGIITM
ncbi:unnamed protein product [Mytilus coruscus]|uniref:Apple domain-containing protein n=1 Tax=Mytilus coruscus TaxID=42192 RepID=A0A6J8E3A7_MYTCO|nr:unnamed protein product [Mytilus coruscus]